MTIKPELIETLRNKRKRIIQHTSPEKLQSMHAKGMLSAREREVNGEAALRMIRDIDLLEAHIWSGQAPPPPPRPKLL